MEPCQNPQNKIKWFSTTKMMSHCRPASYYCCLSKLYNHCLQPQPIPSTKKKTNPSHHLTEKSFPFLSLHSPSENIKKIHFIAFRSCTSFPFWNKILKFSNINIYIYIIRRNSSTVFCHHDERYIWILQGQYISNIIFSSTQLIILQTNQPSK